MSDSLNINVSGGNISIGSINQGENSRINSNASASDAIACEFFSSTYKNITEYAEINKIAIKELKIVYLKLDELKEAVLSKQKETQKGKNILKFISNNFSWAYPMFKDLATTLWPSLLTM